MKIRTPFQGLNQGKFTFSAYMHFYVLCANVAYILVFEQAVHVDVIMMKLDFCDPDQEFE